MPIKFCPKCETKSEVTKKGYNTKGQQRWLCKNCGKTFVEEGSPIVRKTKNQKKKSPVKVTSAKSTKSTKIKTLIKVNAVDVKSVNGDISVDEAFEMVSDYFREVTKTEVKETKKDGLKTITFKVRTGTKGVTII